MILLIDDAKEGGWADYIACNAIAGKMLLNKLSGFITELHIDFDLGCGQNGLDVLKYGLENNYLPNRIWLVSLNPPGRETIGKFLLDNGYKQQGNKFEKK